MASVFIDLPASTVSIPTGASTELKQDEIIAALGAKVASHVQSLTLNSVTAQSFAPPANAKSVKIMADADNLVNLKVAMGTTATASVGMVFEAGRSEDFGEVATVSIICKPTVSEPTPTAQGVYLVWGA